MRDEQRKTEDNINYGGRQVKLTIFFALRDRQPKMQIITVKRAWRQIDLTFAGGAFVSGFENVILMLSPEAPAQIRGKWQKRGNVNLSWRQIELTFVLAPHFEIEGRLEGKMKC